MKDQISFVSGLFDTAPSVPPVANDHHFGEDVAVWMAGKSKDSEFDFGAPVRTPTGWAEPVTADGESFILGFGLMDGYIGSDYAEWRITIDKARSWRTLGASGSSSRSRLCDHIHNILRDERQIREVHWD
jgi:hypothetical protein